MPTPMSKFAEIAQRFHVDPSDEEAVDRFFESEVQGLSPDERERVLAELLDSDGNQETEQTQETIALPKNVSALPLSSAEPVTVPPRAVDPARDGDELSLVVEWMKRWLNEFLRASDLAVIADVRLTHQNRVQVGLAGPDATRLEVTERKLLESMKQLTSRVAEVHPGVEDLVDFVVHGEKNDARFTQGLDYTLSATGKPRIIRMEQISIRPMSQETAAQALQNSPDEFIVFRDLDTDDVSVIYKRRDSNLGLIAPNRLQE